MNYRIVKAVCERLLPVTLPKINRKFSTPVYDKTPNSNVPVLSIADLKATKFTNSGIIGLKINKHQAAMVEISCEKKANLSVLLMLHFVENVLDACHLYLDKQLSLNNYDQIFMMREKLEILKDKYGLSLANHVKSMSSCANGLIVPKKAICLSSLMSLQFYGLTTDSMRKDFLTNLGFDFGQCGILLAYKKHFNNSIKNEQLEILLNNICKHILVMKPLTIDPRNRKNVSPKRSLLSQSYMFDRDISVAKFAALNGIKLVDFKRFECGNDSNDDHIITPDLIECTSQFFGTLL